jgi:hypothetical protein
MSTVVIEQVRIQLTVEQLIDAVRQLPLYEQDQVRRVLDDSNWQDRFRSVLQEIGRQVSAPPIPSDTIQHESAAALRDRYHRVAII